jgi:alpha-L-arabinofuranosidase
MQNAQETEINIRGARISDARATVLTANDVHAHNTFDQPHALEPTEKPVQSASPFVYSFAPASLTRLEFDLA